jgi:hypothetical protein
MFIKRFVMPISLLMLASVSVIVTRVYSSRVKLVTHTVAISAVDFECDRAMQQMLAVMRDYSFVHVNFMDCVMKQDVIVRMLRAGDQGSRPRFLVAKADHVDRPSLTRLLAQLGVQQPICWDAQGRVDSKVGMHRGPQLVEVNGGKTRVPVRN